eukprot:365471-Chlamydomonas_euryale.AAC.12
MRGKAPAGPNFFSTTAFTRHATCLLHAWTLSAACHAWMLGGSGHDRRTARTHRKHKPHVRMPLQGHMHALTLARTRKRINVHVCLLVHAHTHAWPPSNVVVRTLIVCVSAVKRSSCT